MSKIENKLLPELRFPEFEKDGEWEIKTVEQVAFYENGKAHEQDIDSEGKYKVVNSKFISTDGEVVKYTNQPFCLADENDILMVLSDVPNGRAIAKCFYVDKNDLYTVNQRICKLKPFDANSKLLYYLLNRNAYFLAFDDGIKQTNLKNEDVLNCPIILPKKTKNNKEQQKIASCLSSLDDVIAAHTDKLENLKQYKKALLQNVFPQEGTAAEALEAKVPKLRFKEFEKDGEWEEKSLGEYLIENPEYGINAASVPFSENLPTYLRITDISEEGNFIRNNKVSVKNNNITEKNYLSVDDIVLARTGASVGKSYKYKTEDGKLVFAGFLIRIKVNKQKLDSSYLFQFLSTNRYWKWVSFISARSGQPGINATEYSSMPVYIPVDIQEQQKIASLLSSVDDLVQAETDKIAQLKAHKKGLLQGLFPKIES